MGSYEDGDLLLGLTTVDIKGSMVLSFMDEGANIHTHCGNITAMVFSI